MSERERVAAMKQELQAVCQHTNETVIPYGQTGMLARVICRDCGHEREWNAY